MVDRLFPLRRFVIVFWLGIAPELIDVLPNVLPFAADQLSLAREEGPTSATCLPFLAIVRPRGLDLVLEAMVHVVKQYPQARFVHGPIDQVLRVAAVMIPMPGT